MRQTYCLTRVVIVPLSAPPTSLIRVYLADYMAEKCEDLTPEMIKFLGTSCVRVFDNVRDMTELLVGYPCVIEEVMLMPYKD